jgi:YD repeat-containing protein
MRQRCRQTDRKAAAALDALAKRRCEAQAGSSAWQAEFSRVQADYQQTPTQLGDQLLCPPCRPSEELSGELRWLDDAEALEVLVVVQTGSAGSLRHEVFIEGPLLGFVLCRPLAAGQLRRPGGLLFIIGHTPRYPHRLQLPGSMNTITDPEGYVTYFEGGAKVEKMIRVGSGTTYHECYAGETKVTDPLGNVSYFGYAANGRLTFQEDALHSRSSFAYDDYLNQTSETDPRGNTWHYTWDYYGNLTSITDPLNHTTTYEYQVTNPKGNRLIRVTDSAGTTYYSWDVGGNLIQEIDLTCPRELCQSLCGTLADPRSPGLARLRGRRAVAQGAVRPHLRNRRFLGDCLQSQRENLVFSVL